MTPAEDPQNPPAVVEPRPLPLLVRWLLMVFAVLCLVLAAIGVVAPGMPTTVFVLMAAWAAARSSPRLHRWLLNHRLFGPLLRNWENGRTVSRRAKWSATAAMAFCAVVIVLTAHKPWLAGVAIGSMAVVLTWLWRRPEPPLGG
ncbi:YbaN family protein [Variovorax boronicumulans]